MKNYEFIKKDTIMHNGVKLTRIKAKVDYPNGYVKAGDLGGYIEKEDNLSDWAWVDQSSKVYGNAIVCHNAWVSTASEVFDYASVSNNAHVSQRSKVYEDASIEEHAIVSFSSEAYGNANVFGNSIISYRTKVFGNAKLHGDSNVRGNITISEDVELYGNASITRSSHTCNYDVPIVIENAKDIVWFSNVGTDNGTLTVFKNKDQEVFATRGCFFGTVKEFKQASKAKHDLDMHKKYKKLLKCALLLIDVKKESKDD